MLSAVVAKACRPLIYASVSTDMCVDAWTGTSTHMCADLCTDVCRRVHSRVRRHVCRQVRRHVCPDMPIEVHVQLQRIE